MPNPPLIMDLTEMIAECRSELQEPNPGFFTDREFTRWINLGLSDFCVKTRILKSNSTVPSQIGKKDYSLDPRYMQMRKVFYDGRRLRPLSWEQLLVLADRTDMDLQDVPKHYYFMGSATTFTCLYLYPVPSAVKQIEMWYIAKPLTLVTGTDTPLLDPDYHHAICLFAVAKGHQKQRQFEEARRIREEYAEIRDLAMSRRVREHLDEPILQYDETIFEETGRARW